MKFRFICIAILLTATVIACSTQSVQIRNPESGRQPNSSLSLEQAAALSGRHFGTSVTTPALTGDTAYTNILSREFGVVVPENSMKMASVQPDQGHFMFSSADKLVDYAQAHQMLVRGTCLAWNEAVPDWVTNGKFSGQQLEGILSTHIATVVGHFRDRNPGVVKYWDVVNEAFDNDTGKISQSIWNAIGNASDDYIAKSFIWAHAADPDAVLFLNDHRIEEINTKSDVVYAKVKALLAQRVPIHGIGFQFHILPDHTYDFDSIKANFQRFATLGLTLQITELDDRLLLAQDGSVTAAQLSAQADTYANVATACLSTPACKAIVVWEFTDKYSWIPAQHSGWGTADLFDSSFNPKPAYQSVLNVLSQPLSSLAYESRSQIHP